jgi:hypothetical protein
MILYGLSFLFSTNKTFLTFAARVHLWFPSKHGTRNLTTPKFQRYIRLHSLLWYHWHGEDYSGYLAMYLFIAPITIDTVHCYEQDCYCYS